MTTADKTTFNSLITTPNPAGPSGVSALINARTPEQKANLHRRLTDAIRNSAPAIGQYWKGQGGIYAGIIRDGDCQWHLILVTETTAPGFYQPSDHYSIAHCAFKGTWGNYPNTIEGEFSRVDGMYNTHLILASEPDNYLANAVTSLSIDGHTDCYWPSQFENNLLRINLPEHLAPEWHWSSTQFSVDTAWGQDFEVGYTLILHKGNKRAVRAVRRIPIE